MTRYSITRRDAREQQAWNRLAHCRWETETVATASGIVGIAVAVFVLASIALGAMWSVGQ